MNAQEIPVSGKSTFSVVLKDQTVGVEEVVVVVVVGYGVQKKESIVESYSISRILHELESRSLDVRGRIVFNTRISGTTKTLDLRGVQSGLYIVRITGKHSVLTKKMMIK